MEHSELALRVLESAPDAYIVVNRQGVIVAAFGATREVFGWPASELIGQVVNDLVPPGKRIVHQHLVSEFSRQPVKRAMGEGGLLKAMRRDNTEIPVRTMLGPIEVGDQVLTLAAVRDASMDFIRERVQRDTLARFWDLFETSTDGVYISAKDGRILEANQSMEEMLGYSTGELKRINAEKLYAVPAERERFQTVITETGSVRELPVDLRRKDGVVRSFLLTATVHHDDSNQIAGYQGIVRPAENWVP